MKQFIGLFVFVFIFSVQAVAADSCPVGGDRWVLDRNESVMRLMVFAEDGLSKLAQDHIVALPPSSGQILRMDKSNKAKAELEFLLSDTEVNSAIDRHWSGYFRPDQHVSESNRRRVRSDLMGPKLLDAESHPSIDVSIDKLKRFGDHFLARVAFTVKGERHENLLVFAMENNSSRISIEGDFVMSHTDLGLEPFSVLGGLIRTKDPIAVSFDISFVQSHSCG